MAEKPRLKKSDEILGSIAAEPKRKARGEGAPLRSRAEKAPDAYTPDEDLDEEGFELEESFLPSAQSLAEKLMAREDKRRKLNFEKYELPKRGASAEAPAAMEIPVAKAPPAASFDMAMEIPAASPPPPPPPPPDALPVQQPPVKPEPPAAKGAPVLFESNSSSPTVMEYTFESFEQPPEIPEIHAAPPGVPPEKPVADRRSIRSRARRRAQPDPEPQAEPEFLFGPQPERPAALSGPQEFVFEEFTSDPEPEETPLPARPEPVRPEPVRPELVRPEPVRPEPVRPEPVRPESVRPEPVRPEPVRPEPVRPEPVRTEPQPAETPEERRRREFLERISSQFERQFGERFEDGILEPRETAGPPEPEKKPRESIFDRPVMRANPSSGPETVSTLTPPDEDFYTAIKRGEQRRENAPQQPEKSDRNTQDFLSRFMDDIAREEEQRSEDFKETLAEKFMRERERYLKDLGISVKEPEPESPQPPSNAGPVPQRRKLDFQIQPEMHLQDGEPRPVRAPQQNMTYNRGGAAIRPQPEAEAAPIPPLAGRTAATPAKAPPAPRKKTSEQLLIEHGRLTQKQKIKVPKKQKKADKPLKFTFETPEEQAQRKKAQTKSQKKSLDDMLPKEKWPRRIVLVSMMCGFVAIFLLVIPLIQYMDFSRNLHDQTAEMAEQGALAFSQDTLDVYNTQSFDQTAQVNNVFFKNADVALRNVNVKDYVIIESIQQEGKIRLEDVNVDSAISLRGGGINELELHNVNARRVIINNPDTDVTLSVTGSSGIETIELRTTSSVRQLDIQGESTGVRDMVITTAEGGITAKLDGLRLESLSAAARETILLFDGATHAENMSSDGSLSLSGTGRVANLSIGARTGQGAEDPQAPQGPLSFVLTGVNVSNLNFKSPLNASISAQVDALTTSDDLNIDGEGGSIGIFTVNPGRNGVRIAADISGVSVNTAYTNAESRLNISYSANVNALVANMSTFILGNKVNHLIVNANNVVYDTRPDSITVAEGVIEPINRADNPGFDLDAPTIPNADGDSVMMGLAPTCGHTIDAGGFTHGDGTAESPFEVSTPLQLSHVAMHLDAFFVQTTNINIGDDASLRNNFTMIGTAQTPFSGVYDGAGFAVSGLNISSDAENVGLFAANSGIIQNMWLVSGSISSTSTRRASIGGIAGINMNGGSIRASSNGASIFGNANTFTGGIAGQNSSSRIHDCFNYGNISGADNVGGIAGANRLNATIAGSYSAGIIEGRDRTGAVVGINEDATITNTYYLVNTWETGIGEGNGTAIPKTSAELANADMAMELSAGNENTIWISGQTSSNGYRYPMHRKP